jgi:transforming growth factor-beta-induced protein
MTKNSILLSVCDLPKDKIEGLGLSYRDIGIRCNKIIKQYSLKDIKNDKDLIKNQQKLRRELSNWVNDPVNLVNSQGKYIGDKYGARITICLSDGTVIHDVRTFCRDIKNKNNRILGEIAGNNHYIFIKNEPVSLDASNKQSFLYSTFNPNNLTDNIKYENVYAYKVKSSNLPSSNLYSNLIQYSPNETKDGDDIDIVSGELMDLHTTRKEYIQATIRRYGYNSRVTESLVTTDHHVCKYVENIQGANVYCRLTYFEFPAPTIIDVAVADGRFTKLFSAVKAAGLVEALSGPGPITVFAPTDAAFNKFTPGALEALLADGPQLTKLLQYHVVAGKVMAADVVKLTFAKTLAGGLNVSIRVENGKVFVNDSQVIITDIPCANGVIHVIDAVLSPQTTTYDLLIKSKKFNTLVAALNAAGLATILSGTDPITVFAPTDAAFKSFTPGALEALLADGPQLTKLLQYHALAGKVMAADVVKLTFAKTLAGGLNVSIRVENGKVFVNDSQVIITDVVGSNGVVIHVIDTVLSKKTTNDLLIKSKKFNTLVAALNAANLGGVLSGPGPVTVFAPTDDAFAALSVGSLTALLADVPQLQGLLKYHAVADKVMAADIINAIADGSGSTDITTLAGPSISINIENGDVILNDSAKVTITDVLGSNDGGVVVHVIDTVLSANPA